jgi:hypothetical protein
MTHEMKGMYLLLQLFMKSFHGKEATRLQQRY